MTTLISMQEDPSTPHTKVTGKHLLHQRYFAMESNDIMRNDDLHSESNPWHFCRVSSTATKIELASVKPFPPRLRLVMDLGAGFGPRSTQSKPVSELVMN